MSAAIRPSFLLAAVAFGCALLAGAPVAHADERADCASAYEQTQRLQQKSELIEARNEAERCARPTCPQLLRDECSKWVTDIESKLPGLVVRSRAGDGCVRTDTKVETQGSRRAPDSDVLYVDPGVHIIKVTDPVTGKTKSFTINFAPGERRDIDVDFAPPDATCGAPVVKSGFGKIPRLTLILGSIGGGLVVAGATMGVIGAVKRSDLDACKPSCSNERIDGVRPFFIAGDVLAGFGLLALGAAAVTYFARDPEPSSSTARSTAPRIFWAGSGVAGSF